MAFGFFNIDTDLLLLENYFFFAPEFCNCVINWLESSELEFVFYIDGYIFTYKNQIGDLMGAIHGLRFVGFIGEVYKVFPFPEDVKDFKQKTDGWKNRQIIEKIILKFAKPTKIECRFKKNGIIQIGDYHFTNEQFFLLVKYVLEGGFPKWLNGEPPEYVLNLMRFSKLRENLK